MVRPPNETTRTVATRNVVAVTVRIRGRSLGNIEKSLGDQGTIVHTDRSIAPALPTASAVGLVNVLR
jgi:hypothetical protein